MLIKTPEFNIKFLNDLAEIIFNNRDYTQLLKIKLETVQTSSELNNLIKDKRVFKDLNFVGSFISKKYDEIISDIDIIQYIRYNNYNYKRLSEIISNTSKEGSNIRFIRFYCGLKQNLLLPWKIDDKGNCNFSLENTYKWLTYIEKDIPKDVYTQIYKILKTQETLSLRDLIIVEEIIKQYTNISWSEKDIKNGFKIEKGIKYDLLEMLKTSQTKNVIKFLYIYNNKNDKINTKTEYCLLDCSLNQNRSDIINFYSYYLNNKKSKFKGLKFHLPENIKDKYRESIISNIGYLTSLASRLELILKIQKYNKSNMLISEDELKRLTKDVMNFASQHKYTFQKNFSIAENQKILENTIIEKFDYLYKQYRPLVKESNIKNLFLYELRGEEGSLQIHKDILQQRIDKGVSCPFFTLFGDDIKTIINISIKAKIEPKELLNCVYTVANEMKIEPLNVVELFSKNNLSIHENIENTSFNIKDNEQTLKDNLTFKQAQYYILFEL